MNRRMLETHNIFYEEDDRRTWKCPPHAISLFRSLLDLDCTVPDELECLDDVGLDQFLHAELNRFQQFRSGAGESLSSDVRARITQELIDFNKMKTEAQRLDKGMDREAEWADFFRDHFFKPLGEMTLVSGCHTRQHSRTSYYYDSFEGVKGRPWTLFAKNSHYRLGYPGLTEPKPDWAAYFPVYDIESKERIRTAGRWRGWSTKSALTANFSLEMLKHLASHGLEPSTTGRFHEQKSSRIVASDYLCFPWLIVEHKKTEDSGQVEFCYCQAANAGMAALTMFQRLARYAERRPRDAHIPPITTVTTIGPEVRVWVMYVSEDGSTYRMNCVWVGRMNCLRDIIHFQAILENCHTWAMRAMRPWISELIDQWKYQHPLRYVAPSNRRDTSEFDLQALTTGVGAMVPPSRGAGVGRSETSFDNSDDELPDESTHNDALDGQGDVLSETVGSLLETSLQDSTASQEISRPVLASSPQVSPQAAAGETDLMPDSLDWSKPPDSEAPRIQSERSCSHQVQFSKAIPFKGRIIRVRLPPQCEPLDKNQLGVAREPSQASDSPASSEILALNTDPPIMEMSGTSQCGTSASKNDRTNASELDTHVDIARQSQPRCGKNDLSDAKRLVNGDDFVLEKALFVERLVPPETPSSTDETWLSEALSFAESSPSIPCRDKPEDPKKTEISTLSVSDLCDGANFGSTASTSNAGSAKNTRGPRRSLRLRLSSSEPE